MIHLLSPKAQRALSRGLADAMWAAAIVEALDLDPFVRTCRVVIGTGGYASGLPLLAAIHKEIPTVIHEQNSYPGVTTRWLSSRARSTR